MDQQDIECCRALLQEALALTAAGQRVNHIAGTDVGEESIVEVLAPMATSTVSIPWLVTNDDRIDAVVESEQTEWRVVFGSSDRQRIDWINATARPDKFDGVDRGRIVVFNGPSGAGKSTIMRAIRTVADVPWVVFDEPENVGEVETSYLIWREQAPSLQAGFLEAIAALARAGNYVVLSAAGHSQAELRHCFDGIPTLWVGMFCDQPSLVQRERRPDRWGGIAEASLGAHEGWVYDLTFDTTEEPDARELAAEILRVIETAANTSRQ